MRDEEVLLNIHWLRNIRMGIHDGYDGVDWILCSRLNQFRLDDNDVFKRIPYPQHKIYITNLFSYRNLMILLITLQKKI